VREAERHEPGGGVRLIAEAVARLLGRRAVIAKAVRLDDEAELGPVEVGLEPVHDASRLRLRQRCLAHDREEQPFERGVGERERVTVEHLAKDCDPRPAWKVIQGNSQRLGIDEIELVGLVDCGFELAGWD
jgi:hypothetical protein